MRNARRHEVTRQVDKALRLGAAAIGILVMAVMVLGSGARTASAASLPVLGPGVTSLQTGRVLLGIQGTYEDASADKLIKRINEIRKEAYDEGLASSYVPIKWSDELEYIAQIRAAEASVKESHERPVGGYVFDMSVGGTSSWAENLAWGANALYGVEMWYSEKSDLVNHTGGVTGHYESLINPEFTYIGIGSFQASGNWNCVSAEFTYGSGLSEGRTGISGKCIQLIQVPADAVKLSVKGSDDVAVGRSSTYELTAKYNGCSMVPPETLWTSSDETVAAVSDAGTVTGVSEGSFEVTAELGFYGYASGLSASKKVTVTADGTGDSEGDSGQDAYEAAVAAAEKVTGRLSAVKALKGGKASVTWKKAADVDGYEVRYSTDKKFGKSVKSTAVKKAGATKTTIKKLKAGKTYYVQVRTLTKVKNPVTGKTRTVRGKWSKAKKVKAKK